MKWYTILPHSVHQYPSLRAAVKEWAIGNHFGRRAESGVYWITSGGANVYFVREDKLSSWERSLKITAIQHDQP